MEFKEMCRIIHPYTCPACGNDMLFFTRAKNNMIIDYKNILQNNTDNNELMDYLGRKDVEYLKCIICGEIFVIDWTCGYARPLIDKNVLMQFGYKI